MEQSLKNLKQAYIKKGFFPITDKEMTRFNITLEEGVSYVVDALKNSQGGEIIIPKLKSFKIVDLAKAMNSQNKLKILGIRPGEKIHEQMISSSDSYSTYEMKNSYVILPQDNLKLNQFYLKKKGAKKVKAGFEYSSDKNGKFLSIDEIKSIIKKQSKELNL